MMPKSIVEMLYQYIEEHQLTKVLPISPAARQASEEMERLEQLLEGEAARLFRQYLDHEAQAGLERDLALVRCGVSTGLELGRL